MMMFDNYQTLYLEFYKEKIYNKLLLDSDSTNFDNFIIPNLKNYSLGIDQNVFHHFSFSTRRFSLYIIKQVKALICNLLALFFKVNSITDFHHTLDNLLV